MNMLRAMELLKIDLVNQTSRNNKINVRDSILRFYSCNKGIPRGRMIQYYGLPDCGKTIYAEEIVRKNPHLSFIYISSKVDSVKRFDYSNVIVYRSSIFEDVIEFISNIERDHADIVILDDIHTMLSKEEILSAFTKKLNSHELFNKYIKGLSKLSAQKNLSIIIFNSVNLISKKSRYGNMLNKECVASINIIKTATREDSIDVSFTVDRNVMSTVKSGLRHNIEFEEGDILFW